MNKEQSDKEEKKEFKEKVKEERERHTTSKELDEALKGTFPASDSSL